MDYQDQNPRLSFTTGIALGAAVGAGLALLFRRRFRL